MALQISLTPEIERRVCDAAARKGMSVSEFVTSLIQEHVQAPKILLAADVDAALDEFFAANPEPLPSLPADLSREDIYSDHD